MNEARGQERLRRVELDPGLSAGAHAFAAEMLYHNEYDHLEDTELIRRAESNGFMIRSIYENIGRGLESAQPEHFFEPFMRSTKHRANILAPDATHVGVGFVNAWGESRIVVWLAGGRPRPVMVDRGV